MLVLVEQEQLERPVHKGQREQLEVMGQMEPTGQMDQPVRPAQQVLGLPDRQEPLEPREAWEQRARLVQAEGVALQVQQEQQEVTDHQGLPGEPELLDPQEQLARVDQPDPMAQMVGQEPRE